MANGITVRAATIADRPAIRAVVGAAFDGGREELEICEFSWNAPEYVPDLELVAVAESGAIVGHVLHALGRIGDRPLPGLAPLAVRPDRQQTGVGGALLHDVIRRADEAGHAAIFLLGHPTYYPRFGFEPAGPLGITPRNFETFTTPEAAMVCRLSAFDASWRGPFRYCWEPDAS